MECPECGHDQETGSFCSHCGARLGGGCPSCGAELVPGGRYCTQCGEQVGAAGHEVSPHRHRLPWYIAAASVAVLLLVLLLPRQAERAGPSTMTSPSGVAPTGTEGVGTENGFGPPGNPGTTGAPGPLSSDMRTNADRLFNRVMAAAQQGEQEEVARFMPMAIQAYQMVDDLDADGVYHLALLHAAAGQYDEARATVDRLLADSPRHILALGLAARTAAEAGDSAVADALYRRLLDAYQEEAARALPEYREHQRMLPEYRRAAADYVGEDAG